MKACSGFLYSITLLIFLKNKYSFMTVDPSRKINQFVSCSSSMLY